MFVGSWKSTMSGVFALIAIICSALSLATDDNPNTSPDWNIVIAAGFAIVSQIFNGVGLLFTRDDKVTSEEAGAK